MSDDFGWNVAAMHHRSIGIADQCLTDEQKVAKQEADFMKQIDDVAAKGYGAIVPAETYLRMQCLKVAEAQVGLMPAEVLEYAKKFYGFVSGK